MEGDRAGDSVLTADAAHVAPEHVISRPEPGDPLPNRCTCGWIGTDGAVEIHLTRYALATTEAGEES